MAGGVGACGNDGDAAERNVGVRLMRSGSRQGFRWCVGLRCNGALPGKLAEGSFSDPPRCAGRVTWRSGDAGFFLG